LLKTVNFYEKMANLLIFHYNYMLLTAI